MQVLVLRHRPGRYGPIYQCRCGMELQVYNHPNTPFGRKLEVQSGLLHRCPLNALARPLSGRPEAILEALDILDSVMGKDVVSPRPDPKPVLLMEPEWVH